MEQSDFSLSHVFLDALYCTVGHQQTVRAHKAKYDPPPPQWQNIVNKTFPN